MQILSAGKISFGIVGPVTALLFEASKIGEDVSASEIVTDFTSSAVIPCQCCTGCIVIRIVG